MNDNCVVDGSRSVILAVISAKNDLNNQIVLKMAKKADPTGQRTMGKSIEVHAPIDNIHESYRKYWTPSRQLTILYI